MIGTPKKAASVSPSDTTDLAKPGYIYVGTSGSLRLTLSEMQDGTYVDYAPADDRHYSWVVKRVWSTGTTATGIVVHYD